MSNRKSRRAVQSMQRNVRIHSADVMQLLVLKMAEAGPHVVAELSALVGNPDGGYTSGHAVDMLMKMSAMAEKAALAGDPQMYVDAIVRTLFLARDIAIKQGIIVVESQGATKH